MNIKFPHSDIIGVKQDQTQNLALGAALVELAEALVLPEPCLLGHNF